MGRLPGRLIDPAARFLPSPFPAMIASLRILSLALVLGAAGCQWTKQFQSGRDPFGPKAACKLPPEATKEEIVAYLNRNILAEEGQPGLRGWKTDSARVGMHGFSASASIQVAAPRSFRLRVNQPLSNMAMLDIGSNNEQFWVWSKDAPERVVLTCRHDQIAETASQMHLPMPVQPEWLMEVLGVVPLDPNEFRMERGKNHGSFVNLIAECHGPAGEPVQRVIQVDACHGIIREHMLLNAEGSTIARASFSGHYHDPETKLVLVKKIRIELPQDKMVLALDLNGIEVNPPLSDDSVVWQVPQLPGHKTIDLAKAARTRSGNADPKYADASPEFSADQRLRDQPPVRTAELDAPVWPPRESPPASSSQTPRLGFEPEPESSATPAGFELPDAQFEAPTQTTGSPARAFRGQSPASPRTSESGFWSRLKGVFTLGGPSAGALPEAYSPEASRSSWGRPRLGQE